VTASDDDAYTEYVSAKMQWLRGVAYLLCQDWHRADDLGQATITKLYVHWRRASQVANIDGYVRTILVNTFLSEQRSPWWKRVVPQHEDPNSAVPAGNVEAVLDLRDALKTLPPRQRATVVLRYYDELSVQETAEVLGCSVGNVKSQTSRALATLRRILADQPTDHTGDPPLAVLHNGSASTVRDRLPHPEGRRS
jgi:RNA polymerase sigma-70 factor (sigma-E family)